jgi:hypothetical protein
VFNNLLNKYYNARKDVETSQESLILTQKDLKKLLPHEAGGSYHGTLDNDALKKLRKGAETATRRAKSKYKDCQRKLQKAIDDLEVFCKKVDMHWFVATVRVEYQDVSDFIKEKKGLPENYKHISTDSRCWGFFHSLEDAVKRVESNATDMNEAGYYDYAVIEPKQEGLCDFQDQDLTLWFKAAYEDNKCIGYRQCEQPDWAKNTTGWTIS